MPELNTYRQHTTLGRKLDLSPEERKRRSETAKETRKKMSGILTLKQKTFAKHYIANGGNATQAGINSYDADYDNAKVIGSRNLDKPAVVNEINRLLTELGMNDDQWIAKQMKTIVDNGVNAKTTTKDAVSVLNMLLKVKDSYPTRKTMSMRINVDAQSSHKSTSETIEAVKSLSVKSSELIKDLTG